MNELEANTPQRQDNTPKQGNESENAGPLSNVALFETKDPAPPPKGNHSDHGTKLTLWWKSLNWQLIIEVCVLIVGLKVAFIYSGQLDQMKKVNRPYVGLNIIHISVSKEKRIFAFEAEIKNFGPIPASNFKPRWNVFLGSEQIAHGKAATNGGVIFPTQPIRLSAGLVREGYDAVMGDHPKTLRAEVYISYSDPRGENYKSCDNCTFDPTMNQFIVTGDPCSEQP